jgi:hypothetical protein
MPVNPVLATVFVAVWLVVGIFVVLEKLIALGA